MCFNGPNCLENVIFNTFKSIQFGSVNSHVKWNDWEVNTTAHNIVYLCYRTLVVSRGIVLQISKLWVQTQYIPVFVGFVTP